MNMMDDQSEYTMQTRKKRRDYKSLEDGKQELKKPSQSKTRTHHSKERKNSKNHIISIDTTHLRSHEKGSEKSSHAHKNSSRESGKTCGRWTSEEHK
jgi:hypothetical protein